MALDLRNDLSRDRLYRAVASSYRALEPFRNLMRGLVEEYAGSSYGAGAGSRERHETLLNLSNQAVDAYVMTLAANRPRVMLTTRVPQLRVFARRFEMAVNSLIQEICLEQTLRRWVLDAFFCVGIVKVHLADSAPVMLEHDRWMDPGLPYASNVPLDRFVFDTAARTWGEVRFAADSYRVPFDSLRDATLYDQSVVSQLRPTSKLAADGELLERIGRGDEVDSDELEPMIDLADVWLAREGAIHTVPLLGGREFKLHGPPLATMPWNGPEQGNYHLLGFDEVPENILPSSPASHLTNLSRLANNLMRKQSRRARNQRRVNTYTPAGKDAASKIQRSADDQWVEVAEATEIGGVMTGGIDSSTQAFLHNVIEMYDRMAGNLTAMLGLGAQAETLGQEQLIHGSVSKREGQMQARVYDATRKLMRDLGYLLWTDRAKSFSQQVPIAGAEGYAVNLEWTPEEREGDFFDYNIDIDVYSMAYQTPRSRMAGLTQLLTGLYAPLAPLLQQQGGTINFQKLTEILSDLSHEPRLKDIVQFTGVAMGDEQPLAAESLRMRVPTTRNYVRRNISSGGTAAGRAHVQQQAWLDSGQLNDDQRAGLNRLGG